MHNKKGGAPFVESTANGGCPSIRSYGRTDESFFRLVHWLGRFFPVEYLAQSSDGYLEGEFYGLAVTGIASRDGLYLTVAVDVDVNAKGDAVGKQVNYLV